jgi:hypothetical protein
MSSEKYIPTSDGTEILNPDGSSISEIEGHQISKDTSLLLRKYWLLMMEKIYHI